MFFYVRYEFSVVERRKITTKSPSVQRTFFRRSFRHYLTLVNHQIAISLIRSRNNHLLAERNTFIYANDYKHFDFPRSLPDCNTPCAGFSVHGLPQQEPENGGHAQGPSGARLFWLPQNGGKADGQRAAQGSG